MVQNSLRLFPMKTSRVLLDLRPFFLLMSRLGRLAANLARPAGEREEEEEVGGGILQG